MVARGRVEQFRERCEALFHAELRETEAGAIRRCAMTYRMISIVAAAAAFALLFSALVKQSDRVIRHEGAKVACQETAGGCARAFVR